MFSTLFNKTLSMYLTVPVRFFFTCLFLIFVVVFALFAKNSLAFEQSVDNGFLTGHWQQPVKALAKHPVNTQNLSAQSCASCHQKIVNNWQQSLHANAMGAGVLGQLKNYLAENAKPNKIRQPKCLICHAPLAEQAINIDLLKNKNNVLAKEAINCAACHMRSGVILSSVSKTNPEPLFHQQEMHLPKTSALSMFSQAKFCASCHQFPSTGRKLNGKLLQNTYVEWKNSTFAQQGIVCQNCHMPAGQHLWRGIHDKNMVLRGVTINTDVDFIKTTKKLTQVKAKFTLKNTGVGHYFPTYVTPRILLEIYQQDNQGKVIKGSYQSDEIMRAVSLDLVDEYFDSRLAPNESIVMNYGRNRSKNAVKLIFRITVEPDYFYMNFYQAYLENEPNSIGAPDLIKALVNSKNSAYVLYKKELKL